MSRLFAPSTAIITWMSNPAQPCSVWQIYDYSLEPFGSFFRGAEGQRAGAHHDDQDDFKIMLVNHTPAAPDEHEYRGADTEPRWRREVRRNAAVAAAPGIRGRGVKDAAEPPAGLVASAFCEAGIAGRGGQGCIRQLLLKETGAGRSAGARRAARTWNWRAHCPPRCGGNCLAGRDADPIRRRNVAVMAHLQLRSQRTNQRVLPVYYSENYVSLLPGESRTIQDRGGVARPGARAASGGGGGLERGGQGRWISERRRGAKSHQRQRPRGSVRGRAT